MNTRPFSRVAIALLLTGVLSCRQDDSTPSAPESSSGVTSLAATPLRFRQVSAGRDHTCGVTTDDRAYCWGSNGSGQLGDGTTNQRLGPVEVTGGYRFHEVASGEEYTCGVTLTDRAYCWGYGILGDGADPTDIQPQPTPVAVAGGLSFLHVAAHSQTEHTCGITTTEWAYCWGRNPWGQLGNGTTDPSLIPVAVTSPVHFREVSLGVSHTCALNPWGRIFCWGINMSGELGNGTTTSSPIPVRVHAGGRLFRQVSAGGEWTYGPNFGGYTCAVTTDNRAYCWGANHFGTLGDGRTTQRLTPVAVGRGLSFRQVDAGYNHTCGVTMDNRAYCWGRNDSQKLGDDTAKFLRVLPAAVAGGLAFTSVSAGFAHTCGVTTDNRAYCWGENGSGELGDGTTADRPTPAAVAGVI